MTILLFSYLKSTSIDNLRYNSDLRALVIDNKLKNNDTKIEYLVLKSFKKCDFYNLSLVVDSDKIH